MIRADRPGRLANLSGALKGRVGGPADGLRMDETGMKLMSIGSWRLGDLTRTGKSAILSHNVRTY